MNLDARTRAVVDERLFAAYWASVEHFGTTDLVLYFDTEREEPAKDAATALTAAGTAFWLVVSFPDEELIVTAVIAQRTSPGGAA